VTSNLVMAVHPVSSHKRARLPLDGFRLNFLFEVFTKFFEASSTLHISWAQIHFYHRTTNLCTYNINNNTVLFPTCFGARLPSSGNTSSI